MGAADETLCGNDGEQSERSCQRHIACIPIRGDRVGRTSREPEYRDKEERERQGKEEEDIDKNSHRAFVSLQYSGFHRKIKYLLYNV